MAGYTRDFLVSAFADKYQAVLDEESFFIFKVEMGYDHFDKVGRDRFRIETGLDAKAIKEYKKSL